MSEQPLETLTLREGTRAYVYFPLTTPDPIPEGAVVEFALVPGTGAPGEPMPEAAAYSPGILLDDGARVRAHINTPLTRGTWALYGRPRTTAEVIPTLCCLIYVP